MKKVLGILVIAGGLYYITRSKKNENLPKPVETEVNEVQKYEGKIVVDSKGYWVYVENGVLRSLSQKGLDTLNAKGTEIVYLNTPFWEKYLDFAGAGY